jgi:hypothetical protein
MESSVSESLQGQCDGTIRLYSRGATDRRLAGIAIGSWPIGATAIEL